MAVVKPSGSDSISTIVVLRDRNTTQDRKVQNLIFATMFEIIYNSSKRINIKSLISYIHRHIKPYINIGNNTG